MSLTFWPLSITIPPYIEWLRERDEKEERERGRDEKEKRKKEEERQAYSKVMEEDSELIID